jgi:hypothetical protein
MEDSTLRKEEKQMRRVMVATPAFSGEVSADYCQSLLTSTFTCLLEEITVETVILQRQSLLPMARDILLKEAFERGVDDIVWIDSDMAWDAKDLLALLKHKVDVVGIPCRKKIPGSVQFNFQLIPGKTKPDENGLLEVNHLGTGFLKMSAKAVKHLYHKNKKYAADGAVLSNVFELKFDEKTMTMMSEDYAACAKLQEGGFPIYMDTTLSCGHVGSFTYTGDCAHFLDHLNAGIQDTSKAKVVVGISTTPKRIDKIMPTIQTLLRQSRPANRIILSLADKIARSGDTFGEIPGGIQQLVDQGKLEIHRTKDYGPATKFLGAMEAEQDPEAFIIWCDDDMEYGENMIKSLLNECAIRPKAALAMMAFNMSDDNKTYQPVVKNGKYAEILEGFGGVICRRKHLPPASIWKSATPEEFAAMTDVQKAHFLGDDCVMSYSLRKIGTETMALQTQDYNRENGLRLRDVNFGPDALRSNKYTGSNMNSYALLKTQFPGL